MTYLQRVEVTIELLESLEQRDKVGRALGVGRRPRLDDALLIDQCFET
jgi:hypothetical protein